MRKPLFGLIAIAAVCAGLASCTKESINEEFSGNSYSIRIPIQNTATKAVTEGTGKAVSTFLTTDNVYVYNESTNVLDNGTLHPSDDAHEASFVGTLNQQVVFSHIIVQCQRALRRLIDPKNVPDVIRERGQILRLVGEAPQQLRCKGNGGFLFEDRGIENPRLHQILEDMAAETQFRDIARL